MKSATSLSKAAITDPSLSTPPPADEHNLQVDAPPTHHTFDIEHVPVNNDPRAWSPLQKNISLALISSASLIAGLAGNIQNPAVAEMERDLPATSQQFSLSISMFVLIQGIIPLIWSVVSEVKGRKLVYVLSLTLFTVGTIIVAISGNIKLVIGFRCLQAAGSSAVISLGAATLADIFDPSERGRKMGVYYTAPLLGPALGPIIGGALTSAWNWRAIFWFLAIVSGTITILFFLFFQDTFRRERSIIYQSMLKKRLGRGIDQDISMDSLKVSLMDVNPVAPFGQVLRRFNNVVVLFASGLLFGFNFLVGYTSARTLSTTYGYPPFKIGLVTLCYGLGGVAGSILGGRFADRELARLKEKSGGVAEPEMRLRSILLGAICLPPCVVGFGWICKFHVHVSAVCIFLFLGGFFAIWIYSSTYAYIVDANNGRSSTAAASNSAFRGIFAFAATEVAVPLQDGLGDGWTYTIWGGIMASAVTLIIMVYIKGKQWRSRAEQRELRTLELRDLGKSSEPPNCPKV
ncbi:vacuolar DHA amino acid exporter [Panaeolus papilionaceus]|nr:vacuolar DHA amino acid exporter [Panaeolus papilionaceus]